jgi:hypothetical protein
MDAALGGGRSHTERSSIRVRAYLAHRLRFPRDIIAFLHEHGVLPEDAMVADVEAGTEMLADRFDAEHLVIAVEPNDEMPDACRAK